MTVSATARPRLLVSVRSADEAEAALSGGADLIDVKEPSRGSLGRADDATIASVVRTVASRVPVSAAMGEVSDGIGPFTTPGLTFAKWGLARWWDCTFRRDRLESVLPLLSSPECAIARSRPVFVAYADCMRAESPPAEVLCQLACQGRMAAFVIDTFIKDGSTLLDWMPVSRLAMLTGTCRAAGVRIALAGSLGLDEIAAIREVRPDWFAVRGAACRGSRNATIDEGRVRELKTAIAWFAPSALEGIAIDAPRR